MAEILDELAEVTADLLAFVERERSLGARAFPAEPVVPVDLGPEPSSTAPQPEQAPVPARAPVATGPAAPSSSPPAPADGGGAGRWAGFKNRAPKPARTPPPVQGLEAAEGLGEIQALMGDCQRCGLCKGRSRIVFGVGASRAPLMVIGEAPGFHEDRQGEPFVGKAGQMLDRMMANVLNLTREQVYITNVVKCRPPENRNPEPDEIARCRPFLLNQIRVIQPRFLLVLGSVACRAVFGPGSGVTRLRGQWQTVSIPGGEIRAMPTFHPAYLLRKPEDKRLTFADLKLLRQSLDMADG